jgi:histone H3/H4
MRMSQKPLVVHSLIKKVIKEENGMHTSAEALDVLDILVRSVLKVAIDSANTNGRKTVMKRDIEFIPQVNTLLNETRIERLEVKPPAPPVVNKTGLPPGLNN